MRWIGPSAIAADLTVEGRRSAGLDGLRGLAALSVLVFHVWLYRVGRPKYDHFAVMDHVFFTLNLGLLCFFVLSGYLLYGSFVRAAVTGGQRLSTRAYGKKRFARIVPAYYANLVGCLAIYALSGYSHITPPLRQLPVFFLFAQNFSLSTMMQLNPVAWTLCVEMAFYIVLPLIGLVALRIGRRGSLQALLLIGLVAIGCVWNVLAWDHGLSEVWKKALPGYIGYFACGMLVALWAERRKAFGRVPLRPFPTGIIFLAGVVLVVVDAFWREAPMTLQSLHAPFINLLASVGFALVIAAVVGGTGRAARATAFRPIAALGVISYGVYLWHLPLILALKEVDLLPHALVPRIGVVLAVSVIAGFLSWRLVEQPAIRWAHRRAVPSDQVLAGA